MAAEKKNGIDRPKIKALEKLKEAGFDTANKIKLLDARQMLKLGMAGEMQEIFDLQDAIKANHSELAWLLDGEDPKPEKKEVIRHDHDRRPEAGSDEGKTGSFSYGN
jgi:sugar/nucleoside kinase (ribokinase family)